MSSNLKIPALTPPMAEMEGHFSPEIKSRGSRIISRVLSPAIRLWLRSQVEQVKDLHFDITGKDDEILHGIIPAVKISAQNAIYQGLYLSKVALTGVNIHVNLGQVLRGKPLRLLAPIPVFGELRLLESDFNSSLNSPLLAPALKDFLIPFLPLDESVKNADSFQLIHPRIKICEGSLTLTGEILLENRKMIPLMVEMGLGLASSHELFFKPHPMTELVEPSSDDFLIDLGSEVHLEELTLKTGELICRGQLKVLP